MLWDLWAEIATTYTDRPHFQRCNILPLFSSRVTLKVIVESNVLRNFRSHLPPVQWPRLTKRRRFYLCECSINVDARYKTAQGTVNSE